MGGEASSGFNQRTTSWYWSPYVTGDLLERAALTGWKDVSIAMSESRPPRSGQCRQCRALGRSLNRFSPTILGAVKPRSWRDGDGWRAIGWLRRANRL